MKTSRLTKVVAVAGAVTLSTLGATTVAFAEPVPPGASGQVEIGVEIEAAGELYMEVAAGSIALTENGSDATARRFEGNLPEVTVTDTRSPGEVPDDVLWYVMGTASSLTNGTGDTIPADYLGWTPEVTEDQGNAHIEAGEEVESDFEGDGPGLVGAELLYWDKGIVVGGSHAAAGVYKATAAMSLHTPVDVAGGQYAGVLTLSLYED